MHGAGGLGGTDAPTLKKWLLKFRQASSNLHSALANLASWMASALVPHAAIRALLSNRLIALDKNPGVRPLGIGHIWHRLIAKCVLKLTMEEATNAAGIDQLNTRQTKGEQQWTTIKRMMW